MRTFKIKPFARFASREGITDEALCEAVVRAARGLVDADLGGGVIKQRIARRGQGRSGGFLTTVVFRRGDRAFFVYGFARSARKNLRRDELEAFRLLAGEYLTLGPVGPRGDAGSWGDCRGAMSKRTMREFDQMCLTPVEDLAPEEISEIRLRENASQAVFAR